MGKRGSLNSLRYNLRTPATLLISDASVISANGSSPRSNHSRKLFISTCDPDTLKIPWWCRPNEQFISLLKRAPFSLPYKLMTLMHDFIINGISWFVASRYSSNEPANSFGWPFICSLPIRLRRGVFMTGFRVVQKSGASDSKDCLMYSCFASRRAILVEPRTYSRNFYNSTHHSISSFDTIF